MSSQTAPKTGGGSAERISAIITRLKHAYPEAKIALRYSSTWELLVAVILSAQCTDVMVNRVTEKLFRTYPSVSAYADADYNALTQLIRSTGFYRNKAKNIIACATIIRDRFHGNVPQSMDELTALPGVARKTANIILSTAFGKAEGIAVDTHVHRIAQRLRLVSLISIGGKHPVTFQIKGVQHTDYIKDADPSKIEQQLMQVLPKQEWHDITYRIINHGRAVCKARNPQCRQCPLAAVCPAVRTE